MSLQCLSSIPNKKPKQLALIKTCNEFKKKKKKPITATSLDDSHGVSWTRTCLLGKGTFGSVFLAKSRKPITRTTNLYPQTTNLYPLMAVKSATMDKSSSLKHEKQVLDNLSSSPHVIRCYGDEVTFMANGVKIYNLLLEYCSGLSLDRQIKLTSYNNSGLSESDVKLYSLDILKGLKYIHSCGYVHCDIKPCNILLMPGSGDRTGIFVAKVADFGLAKAKNEENICSDLQGTCRFMSPELVREKKVETAVDIWAFGCVVVEMLSGKTAWNYTEIDDLLSVIGYSNQVPRIPSNASENAKDFLCRCFVRSAAHRWSAERLLQHPFLSMD